MCRQFTEAMVVVELELAASIIERKQVSPLSYMCAALLNYAILPDSFETAVYSVAAIIVLDINIKVPQSRYCACIVNHCCRTAGVTDSTLSIINRVVVIVF